MILDTFDLLLSPTVRFLKNMEAGHEVGLFSFKLVLLKAQEKIAFYEAELKNKDELIRKLSM